MNAGQKKMEGYQEGIKQEVGLIKTVAGKMTRCDQRWSQRREGEKERTKEGLKQSGM